jgi:predicted RNA-binding protein with EMAP domain
VEDVHRVAASVGISPVSMWRNLRGVQSVQALQRGVQSVQALRGVQSVQALRGVQSVQALQRGVQSVQALQRGSASWEKKFVEASEQMRWWSIFSYREYCSRRSKFLSQRCHQHAQHANVDNAEPPWC